MNPKTAPTRPLRRPFSETISGSNRLITRHGSSGKKEKPRFCRKKIGALGRTRTCDLLIRSQTLYPAELRAHRERI
jgi:hypothetical protein